MRGMEGLAGIKSFPAKPEKCGHHSSTAPLGTVGHEVGLKRKYLVADKSPEKEARRYTGPGLNPISTC